MKNYITEHNVYLLAFNISETVSEIRNCSEIMAYNNSTFAYDKLSQLVKQHKQYCDKLSKLPRRYRGQIFRAATNKRILYNLFLYFIKNADIDDSLKESYHKQIMNSELLEKYNKKYKKNIKKILYESKQI